MCVPYTFLMFLDVINAKLGKGHRSVPHSSLDVKHGRKSVQETCNSPGAYKLVYVSIQSEKTPYKYTFTRNNRVTEKNVEVHDN